MLPSPKSDGSGPQRRVTLHDLAKVARVDPSTVSRVLNGDATLVVKEETRQRILDAVAELQYVPNALARGLRRQRSQMIGMLVPDIANPFFPQIILGAERFLGDAGFGLLLGNTDEDPQKEQTYVEFLRANAVDGLMLATAFTQDATVDRLEQLGVPYVLVNRGHEGTSNYVVVQDRQAMRGVIAYLVGLGHRRIAHVSGPLYTETGLARLRGYREGLLEARIDYREDYVAEGDFKGASGARAIERLAALPDPPTAVTLANDVMALGALDACRRLGIGVPEDMSLVGYNDVPYCALVTPSLTSVHAPLLEMGRSAAQRLVEMLREPGLARAPIMLEAELVVRDSTAPPSR